MFLFIIHLRKNPFNLGVSVKSFFSNYSYSIIKMFVNQFAISIFGSVLAMATISSGNDILTFFVSCFAIVFYLFLIYTMVWEIGAKDKISVDVGKKEYRPYTGLLMALVANIPNFIIAIVYTIASPLMSTHAWAGNTAAVTVFASFIIQGMYRGVISTVSIAGVSMNQIWWTYFVIIIPSLIASFAAYYLGHKNFRFFAALTQKNKDADLRK